MCEPEVQRRGPCGECTVLLGETGDRYGEGRSTFSCGGCGRELEETPDGARIRLSASLLEEWVDQYWPIPDMPILSSEARVDEREAERVLGDYEELLPSVGFVADCRENGAYFAEALVSDNIARIRSSIGSRR